MKLNFIINNSQIYQTGPTFGLIEMVRDCITLDKLYQKLNQDYSKSLTLNQFFNDYFPDTAIARKNFC